MRLSTMVKQLRALAKAIRKGAKKRAQARGDLFTLDEPKSGKFRLGESCALGAAYEGAFGKPPVRVRKDGTPKINGGETAMHNRLRRKFRVLESFIPGTFAESFETSIITKNDTAGYTRKEIADWLEEQADYLDVGEDGDPDA